MIRDWLYEYGTDSDIVSHTEVMSERQIIDYNSRGFVDILIKKNWDIGHRVAHQTDYSVAPIKIIP